MQSDLYSSRQGTYSYMQVPSQACLLRLAYCRCCQVRPLFCQIPHPIRKTKFPDKSYKLRLPTCLISLPHLYRLYHSVYPKVSDCHVPKHMKLSVTVLSHLQTLYCISGYTMHSHLRVYRPLYPCLRLQIRLL